MRNLYIPEIGDLITLNKDWTFSLYPEYRNDKLGIKLGICEKDPAFTTIKFNRWLDDDGKSLGNFHCADWDSETQSWVWKKVYSVTFGAGTELRVDRIYIRKGNKDYSSISFWIKNGPYKGARFWAKLSDVNQIEFI